jgi:predicted permease
MRTMTRLRSDLRWAWRGIRRRKLAGVAQVLLVALAVGASAVVFSATDAFLFNRAPYPNADRLVVFERSTPVGITNYLSFDEYDALRQRTDLFAAMVGHGMGAIAYVTMDGAVRGLRVEDVQVGVFEALGVRPAWGRTFTPGDERAAGEAIVIVGEELAREGFGDPGAAPGQTLDGPSGRLRIVGVMSAAFRFPTSLPRVWRASTEVQPGPGRAVPILAVLAPGTPLAIAQRQVTEHVRATMAPDALPGAFAAVPLAQAQRDPRAYTNFGAYTGVDAPYLFATMLVASLGLALIVCINVAGLELAAAAGRAQMLGTLTALGATRAALVRTVFLESALITTAGTVAGVALAAWGTAALAATLPQALGSMLANPVDLDVRAAVFLAAVALAASVVTALPVAWFVSRPELANVLQRGPGRVSLSRSQTSMRGVLIATQVALGVCLVAGGVLFARTYAARAGEDKGFDSRQLATIELTRPRGSTMPAGDLDRTVLERLRAHPAVAAVSRAGGLPPYQRGGAASDVWIEGRTAPSGQAAMRTFTVDPDTLATMGVMLRRGRGPDTSDQPGQVVVDEDFARRFWPAGDAIGARFSFGTDRGPGRTTYTVIGVASRVRLDASEAPMGGTYYVMHQRMEPTAAPLTFVARLRSAGALADVTAAVRAVAATATVRTGWMDDRYAQTYGGARIAAGLTTAFALVAVAVVMTGLYGVTAFLVAGRRRELGIRVALGAERRHLRRVVLGPAVRSVCFGAVAGIAGAVVAARVVDSQLAGVTAADASTYVVALAIVAATTLVATWVPMRRASRIDPAAALRAD